MQDQDGSWEKFGRVRTGLRPLSFLSYSETGRRERFVGCDGASAIGPLTCLTGEIDNRFRRSACQEDLDTRGKLLESFPDAGARSRINNLGGIEKI